MDIVFCEADLTFFKSCMQQLHGKYYRVPFDFRLGNYDISLESILSNHPEIQLSVWEAQAGGSDVNIMLHATDTCQNNKAVKNYCALLGRFFERIDLLLIDDKLYGYMLKNLRSNAKDSYLKLRTNNLLNPYVRLIDHKCVNIFKEPFTLYKYSVKEREVATNDAFLNYVSKIASMHKFVGFPICGFTKEEMISLPELNMLIRSIGIVYILFSDGLSIGAYIIED